MPQEWWGKAALGILFLAVGAYTFFNARLMGERQSANMRRAFGREGGINSAESQRTVYVIIGLIISSWGVFLLLRAAQQL